MIGTMTQMIMNEVGNLLVRNLNLEKVEPNLNLERVEQNVGEINHFYFRYEILM
jgi:hypothetical protein